jgi:dethiobiotin synthetase
LTGARPHRLVVVVGTGTDVGKTWVSARLLTDLRAAGLNVAARKPAQSFDPGDDPAGRDAAVLGAASGEASEQVCPRHRWYEVAMADLVSELAWPASGVDVGLVETAGGVRSPLAADGDAVSLCHELMPDLLVLVADAGLGTINAVRLTTEALRAIEVPQVVVLNRFDVSADLHVGNRSWLRSLDPGPVVTIPDDGDELAMLVAG